MTQSAYANSTINNMLGWMKGFAGWVLKLFNLAGSGGLSPLGWLADNWLRLLVVLLLAGIVIDWLVWLLRWRPYWVWFRKKRIVIKDDDFFAGEDTVDSGLFDRKLFGREVEERTRRRRDDAEEGETDFVVASTIVQRDGAARARSGADADAPRGDTRRAVRKAIRSDRRASTRRREEAGERPAASPAAPDPFAMEADDPEVSSFWEDEVFNVSDLPVPDQPDDFEPKNTARKNPFLDDEPT